MKRIIIFIFGPKKKSKDSSFCVRTVYAYAHLNPLWVFDFPFRQADMWLDDPLTSREASLMDECVLIISLVSGFI